MQRLLSQVLLSAFVLASTTGCGVISAIANPKVAWAIQDPAPMSVVLRRADAAETTAVEVDRLLTATPTNPDSDWLRKIAPSPGEAAAEMKAVSQDPMYKKSHARVVASEVWARTLPGVHGTGKKKSLLAAIDKSIGDDYAEIVAKGAELDALEKQLDAENSAADAKDTPADAKKTHQNEAAKLVKAKSDAALELAQRKQSFVASLKERAAKLPADQKEGFAAPLASLAQALEDAELANGAAAARYPLAVRSIPDSTTDVVPVLVADILEEKTGKRPALGNLKPNVSLHGTDVEVTLAGLSPADLGSLSMSDLTKEVVSRSGKWVVRAMTLLATVNSTSDTLSFEHQVVGELLSGLGGARVPAVPIPAADSPQVVAATPATHAGKSRRRDAARPAPHPEAAKRGEAEGKPRPSTRAAAKGEEHAAR